MGLFSNKISRDELKAGDHIYSWRSYIYSHHGIYVGDGEVIHFTCKGRLETGSGTFLDRIIEISVPKRGGNPCPNCGDQSKLEGVISSCLDCFLAGGNLFLFDYRVSPAILMANPRGGTETTAPSDPPEQVISRAEFLLLRKGFGVYDLLNNNCEDFAIFCKTSLIVLSKLGSSGQANSARSVFSCSFAGVVKSVSVGSAAKCLVSGIGGIGAIALMGYADYCLGRLNSDIGVRKDATKIPVEELARVIAIIEGNLDNK